MISTKPVAIISKAIIVPIDKAKATGLVNDNMPQAIRTIPKIIDSIKRAPVSFANLMAFTTPNTPAIIIYTEISVNTNDSTNNCVTTFVNKETPQIIDNIAVINRRKLFPPSNLTVLHKKKYPAALSNNVIAKIIVIDEKVMSGNIKQ